MLPIHFNLGFTRFTLDRAGRVARQASRVSPERAREVLRRAVHQQEQSLQRLAEFLHMYGQDPFDVTSHAIDLISSGLLVLTEEPRQRSAPSPQPQPDRPEEPEERPEDPQEEEEDEDDPPPARTSIRISLFFDGTANNRTNVSHRLRDTETWQDNDDEGSFQNDYSNVARMEWRYIDAPDFEHSFSIYVEGIGTTNSTGDTTIGLALGTGGTGVVAKVRKGIREAIRGIRNLGLAEGEIIERLHVDATGFSRGAAASRHFVHRVLSEDPFQPQVEALGYTVEEFEVNFVGLYDTVASYGVAHYNDTSDLSLDAVRDALSVVQLAAAEEHRKNFRLTNIDSAVNAGVGIELYLPGVHSDIGGGYVDHYAETDLVVLDFNAMRTRASLAARFERERQWLTSTGWYTDDEIDEPNWWNELKVNRTGIRKQYTYIPLGHMTAFAERTGLNFDPIDQHYPIPGALAAIKALVDAHVAAHEGGGSTAEHWINMNTPVYRTLRHDYLHFSAYYNISNPPQWSNGDAMNGVRQRIVQDG